MILKLIMGIIFGISITALTHEYKLLAEENEKLLQENTYLKELLKTQL